MPLLRRLDLVLLLSAACGLAACGEKPAPSAPGGAHDHAHDEKPPHGGEVLELGNHEVHLEVMHDHDGGNIGVYVYGASFEKPLHVARPVVNTQGKDGPVEVVLTAVDPKPDGTAHHWKGQHAALIADPWVGNLQVVVNGKTYQSPLEGAHAHDHK